MSITRTLSDTEINVLLLGVTGVGKTTLINAFANYFVYNTLDEALRNGMEILISSYFTYMDQDTFEDRSIKMKANCEEEIKISIGESSTKVCRSFLFIADRFKIRFIDTPGLGDTTGPFQDMLNIQNILSYISQFKYLHGVCLLFKPTVERLTTEFKYCFNEIIRLLNENCKDHIYFVFTNAKDTHYQLSRASPTIKAYLQEIKRLNGHEIPFNRNNSFLFENESFRYLALRKNGIDLNYCAKDIYDQGWQKTVEEFSRMLKFIIQRPAYDVKGILSLNEAQQLLRRMARPIAEAIRFIEQNLELAQTQLDQLEISLDSAPSRFYQIQLKIKDLGHPRTVSTNPRFMKPVNSGRITMIEYISHCHPHCYLKGVEAEVVGHPELQRCSAMNKYNGK